MAKYLIVGYFIVHLSYSYVEIRVYHKLEWRVSRANNKQRLRTCGVCESNNITVGADRARQEGYQRRARVGDPTREFAIH